MRIRPIDMRGNIPARQPQNYWVTEHRYEKPENNWHFWYESFYDWKTSFLFECGSAL